MCIAYFVPLLACLVLSAQCCHFITNVTISVLPQDGDPYETLLNGCIQRTAFNSTIVKAFVENQRIQSMSKGTVQNMIHLNTVAFRNCGSEDINPGAFRNVPSLSEIEISFSKIPEIPSGVFGGLPALELLRLDNNRLHRLEEGALGNLTGLRKFHASYNRLDVFNPKWFVNSTGIVVIDLRHNLLRNVPAGAFRNLPKMWKIYFDYNDIEGIAAGAFEGPKGLSYLGLRYNRLKTIGPEVFPLGFAIDVLAIDANRLNFLWLDFGALKVKNLTLDGNPWICPCRDEVIEATNRNDVTVKNSASCLGNNIPTCVFSVDNSTECLGGVDEEATAFFLETTKAATINDKNFLIKKCVRFD